MSIFMETAHDPEHPLNHARICYANEVFEATATGEAAYRGAASLLTSTTYERWSPDVSGDSVTLTFSGGAITADYIAIGAIESGSEGNTPQIKVHVERNGSFELVTSTALIGNQPMLFLLEKGTITAVRITLTFTELRPSIGIVYAGLLLTMARPFYQGHNPALLTSSYVLQPNISESGEWLGVSLLRQGRDVKMSWENLSALWVRTKWMPFSLSLTRRPFFVAWNPLEHPSDVILCTASQTPAPSISGPRDLMSVSLSARGYSDGTDPRSFTSSIQEV